MIWSEIRNALPVIRWEISRRFKADVASLGYGLFIWYRNEFRSRVKFVLHSHVKIERLSLRRSGSLGFCAKSDTHSPLAADYKICDFQFPNEVLPEWNFSPKREFHSKWKKEWTHFGTTCTGTNVRHGILWTLCKWIHGDGMNSSGNGSHSSIM